MGGRHSTEAAFLLCTQQPRFGSRRYQFFSIKKLDFAEIDEQWHCLERVDSAKSIIVDGTLVVLVSGKLVLHKTIA